MSPFDHWLGDPDRASGRALERLLRRAPDRHRIRAAIAIAHGGDLDRLGALLEDPCPGVRRFAARGVGWVASNRMGSRLLDRFRLERNDTVRAALLVAAERCGHPIEALCEQAIAERLWTTEGWRRPAEVPGADEGRLDRALAHEGRGAPLPGPLPPDRDRWAAWASQGPVGALEALRGARGRREGHAVLHALGWLGDPRAARDLRRALQAVDRDPGRGFAQRRHASAALGRLGDRRGRGVLETALDREARDFEGRPGSGLGIQFPVRATILWALGELGAPESARTLASVLLSADSGAGGARAIAAMAALIKLGPAIAPAIAPLSRHEDAAIAARAVAVLRAVGIETDRDRRPLVRAAAEGVAP